MHPTPFRSLALVATAALVLSGCASKKDPMADMTTTATGLGTYGAPTAPSGAGLGGEPVVVGGFPGGVATGGGVGGGIDGGIGGDLYGSTGTLGGIEGSTLGGVGQGVGTGTYGGQYADQGAYGVNNGGLVDGGIISAAPQYEDGTVYTDTAVYDGSIQPYDNTLFDDSATGTGGSQYTTYDQGNTALGGYSFPGDNGQPSYFITQVGNRVLFETDSVILTDGARETLRRQAAWLQLHPESAVILEGHADERGTREYNLALGARRAEAVRAYLSSLGVTTSRLRTVSYGKERPISVGTGPSEWAKNRRVETVPTNGASF